MAEIMMPLDVGVPQPVVAFGHQFDSQLSDVRLGAARQFPDGALKGGRHGESRRLGVSFRHTCLT
jgi:hypothetical protein